MATTPAIDYDALAQQHGAAIDYDALASQHGGAAGDAGPSTYSKLTANYNPGAEDYAQKHPIFGPVVRFLDAAGGAAMSTPEGIYQALSHPSDTAKSALESIKAWRDPATRAGALGVLPEALGTGVGNVAGGEATGAVTGAAADAAKSVIPSAETIAKAARTEKGTLKPGVKVAAKAAGAGAGGLLGGGWGALVGEHIGAGLADSVIPSVEPTVAKATPLSQSPNYPKILAARRAAVAEAKAASTPPPTPEPTQIVSPDSSPSPESEGRPATWRNLKVSELAGQSGPLSFDAAKQAQLRQLDVPNVGLVADPRATAAPTLNAPRSVTIFDAQGNPVPAGGVDAMAETMAKKPNYGYRVRDVGEEGVPIGGNSRAHATTTLDDAQRLAPGREDVQGKPQEIVKYDLSKLKEGKDYERVPREGQPDWIRMLRPLKESEVQPVKSQ